MAEFLPISSSAHLVLVPWLLRWPHHSLTYDVALHMGTLAALLTYFWRDWWNLVTAWLPARGSTPRDPESRAEGNFLANWILRQGPASLPNGQSELVDGSAGAGGTLPHAPKSERALRRRLGASLVVATMPAAVIGALFADRIEASLRAPSLIALLLMTAAVLLAAADRAGIQQLELEAIGSWQAVTIGVAQALALAPGVSRSGITLAAGLFLGLRREAAARYGFLLAAPITAGAGLFQLRHLLRSGIPEDERAAFGIGVVTSLGVGVLVIGGLLRYLRRQNLNVFVGYRLALGLLVLAVALWRAR